MTGRDTVVGLDFGRQTVKAVWARNRGGKLWITRAETLRLPQAAPDIKALLLPWIEQQGIARHPCVVGVPGHQCMFQPFILTPRDPRTPAQAAAMEVIRFNEMASEQMGYGFITSAVNPAERMVLLGMARPAVINDILTSTRGLGLDVVDMVPSPVASFHALKASVGDHAAPILFISIGHGSTDIAIGSQNGLLFARSFAGGGEMFTEALAKSAGQSAGQAENLKVNEGSMLPGKPTASIFAPVADSWLAEIESCLSVYENATRSSRTRPARAVLAGGGALLPGLAEHAAPRLRMEVSTLESLPAEKALARPAPYAVAAGLAMAGLGIATDSLSLLPNEIRNEMLFRSKKPYWIAAGLAAGLVMAVSIVGGYRHADRRQTYLNELKINLQRRQALVSQYETLKAENARMHEMSKPVKKMLRAAPAMRDLVTLAADSLAPRDQIVMVSDAESFFAPPELAATTPTGGSLRDRRRNSRPPKDDKKTSEMTFERVIIEGYTQTPEFQTVKALIEEFRGATNFVQSADLLRDDDLASGKPATIVQKNPGAKHFVIDVRLTPP